LILICYEHFTNIIWMVGAGRPLCVFGYYK
jgi:hypothetical protein